MKHDLKTLQEAFDFSVEELELNRAGDLSAAQQKRLESHLEVRGCGRRAALIAFGAIAAGMFVIPLLFSNESGISQARLFIWGVAGLILLLVIVFGLIEIFSGRDMSSGSIKVMEGVVHTKAKDIGARGSRLGTAYMLTIANREFQLMTAEQMDSFTGGYPYRFYYIPNGRVPIIFAVEPLEPLTPSP